MSLGLLGTVAATMIFLILMLASVLMALFPRKLNRQRMKFRLAIECPDWYIRALGVFGSGFLIVSGVLIILLAK